MFKFSANSNYVMPAHFGGYEGQPIPSRYQDVTTITVSYETDPGSFGAIHSGQLWVTHPVITVQYGMMRGVDCLAGGGHNLITVGVPASFADARELDCMMIKEA